MFKRMYPLYNADGAMGGGEGASGGDVAATSNSADGFTSGWGLPKGQEQVSQNSGNQAAVNANPLLGQPQQAAAAPQPQVFDFAGRKIEVNDPAMLNVLKDVHKDYSSLQSTYTQTTNQVKELQNEKQTYMQLLQNMQQQTQAAQAPAQQQQAPVDLEQVKADFMEQFYDDPKGAIEGLLDGMFQQKVQPVIEPMQKERAWNDEVQGLQSKYEDFGSMIGPMQQLLQDMPQLAQHGLESVYQLAKRSAPAPQPTPEQLLNDPAFREQALAHPEVYQQAVSRYVNERQQMNQQIPVVMGNQPGGQIPSAPETRPKDIRGGSKAWLQSLGLGG